SGPPQFLPFDPPHARPSIISHARLPLGGGALARRPLHERRSARGAVRAATMQPSFSGRKPLRPSPRSTPASGGSDIARRGEPLCLPAGLPLDRSGKGSASPVHPLRRRLGLLWWR